MPDVGLFSASDPVPDGTAVIIRYSVEVGGLPVYNESYDVDTLIAELAQDEAKALQLWARRLKCVAAARHRPGFSAAVTRCLTDGVAADCGSTSGVALDSLGHTP